MVGNPHSTSFGLLGLVWAVYWLMTSHETPESHPRISDEEKELLRAPASDVAGPLVVPVRRILTHPAVWAIIVNKFCTLWMVYVFLAWLPSYFSSVQGISLAGSGLFAALPWIAMSLMLYVASGFSDGLLAKGRALDFVRKSMQVAGLAGSMVFLLLIPLADSALMALLATCCAMAALACCYSGADPAIMEIAPRYRGFITGLVGSISNLPGIIAIPMIGWLVDTTGSYSWGFISAAVLNLIGIVVWLLFGTGRKVID